MEKCGDEDDFDVEFCKQRGIRIIVVDNRTFDNPNEILYDSHEGFTRENIANVWRLNESCSRFRL